MRVEQDYRFDTEDGERTLAELFDGRSQLLVYHFMFGPSYEAGDAVNSSIADTIDGLLPHLHARDVTFVLASGAPIEKLAAYRRRMGWGVPWVSTARTSFNVDLGFSHSEADGRDVVEQMIGSAGVPPIVEHNARLAGTDAAGYMTESPGFSAFVLDDGAAYHTYSTTWRGLEFLMGYYPILDHAPKGRDEGADVAALAPPPRRVLIQSEGVCHPVVIPAAVDGRWRRGESCDARAHRREEFVRWAR